jgi:predicted deacylase
MSTVANAMGSVGASGRAVGDVVIGTMASGAAIAMPFVCVKGARPGRTLWINGQVHGVEVTGIVAALEFANALEPSEMAGRVVVTSTANPLGFDGRRKNAHDDNDLDQTFPGRADGYISERFAHRLLAEIRALAPDLVISMHAQGPQVASRSYTVYKQPPGTGVAESALFPWMAAFRPLVACRMDVGPGSGELLGNHAGALDYQLNALGIACFMVELGVGQRADPAEVETGVAGFREVARQLGILRGEPAPAPPTLRLVTRRGHLPISNGGLFRPACGPGDVVRAGTPLGKIMNLHGRVVETVAIARDALVIAIRVDPVVHCGDRVGYLAYEWGDVPVS